MSTTSPSVPAEQVTQMQRASNERASNAVRLEILTLNEPRSSWSFSTAKRAFDLVVSFAALLLFAIPMLVIAAWIRLSSSGGALFVQERIGKGGRKFKIYKFRSMESSPACSDSLGLTASGDCRITEIGRILRAFKLDELPQLINIVRGDMSLVGPRPKTAKYADDLNMVFRPGLTGAASLAFRNEEELLSSLSAQEIEPFYMKHIKPIKAQLDYRYMLSAGFESDLRIIAATFFSALRPEPDPELEPQFTPKSASGLHLVEGNGD